MLKKRVNIAVWAVIIFMIFPCVCAKSANLSVFSYSIDSIKRVLPRLSTDSLKYDAYKKLGNFYTVAAPDTALKYYIKSNYYARRTRNPHNVIFAMTLMANAYTRIGDYGSAIDSLKVAVKLGEQIGDKQNCLYSYAHLGHVYSLLGRNEEAGNIFRKADRMINFPKFIAELRKVTHNGKKQLGDVEREAYVVNAVFYKPYSEYFNELGKLDSAKIMIGRIIQICELDHRMYAKHILGYCNLGDYESEAGHYKAALPYYLKSLEVLKTAPPYYYKFTEPEINFYIARCYYHIGDYKMARHILDLRKSENLSAELKFDYYILDAIINIKLGQLQSAMSVLTDLNRNLKDFNNSQLLDIYEVYKNYYRASGDLQKALYYNKKMNDVRDSLFMDNNVESVASKLLLLQYSKKEHELNLSRQNNAIAMEKYKSGKLVQFILIGLFFGIIFLLLIVIKNSKTHKKALKNLGTINAELAKVNTELGNINATKDKFFSIIANDLRTPISETDKALSDLNDRFDQMTDKEKLKSLDDLKDLSYNTFLLLQDLLTWSRSQRGKIEFNPINVNLQMLVQNVMETEASAAVQKEITVENKIPEDAEIFADPGMSLNIIKILFKNAVKYSERGKKVEIGTPTEKTRSGFTAFYVKDEGVGMTAEKVSGLFKVNTNNSTPGTAGEKGTGLGLILTREFLDKNGGEIEVESKPGCGSTFTVFLPEARNEQPEL